MDTPYLLLAAGRKIAFYYTVHKGAVHKKSTCEKTLIFIVNNLCINSTFMVHFSSQSRFVTLSHMVCMSEHTTKHNKMQKQACFDATVFLQYHVNY